MALHGTLDALDTLELLQALNVAGKTGLITAEGFDNGARVRLHLKSGQVVWAEGMCSEGDDAVLDFLSLRKGVYTFRSTDVDGMRNVFRPTEALMLQWAIRLDERHVSGQ